jgi:hypothetical protein
MKPRMIVCLGLIFFVPVSTCSALELSGLAAPFVSAARFVGGLWPFGAERKEQKAEQKAEQRAAEKAAEVPPVPTTTAPDQVIGTVRFAYDNFVLIYTPIKLTVPAGTRVTTVGKDGLPQDVQLSMSAERKGTFLVADVISGQPMAGDLVVLASGPKSSTVADYQVLE